MSAMSLDGFRLVIPDVSFLSPEVSVVLTRFHSALHFAVPEIGSRQTGAAGREEASQPLAERVAMSSGTCRGHAG